MRAFAFVCVAALGCANNVPQDRKTGPDGRLKGAKVLALENGEAKDNGVVTYPGGDRVDWKVIEIPEGKQGRLDLAMKWETPRPGLQLAFDVFDQWQHPVANAKGSKGRVRDTFINDAKGKYFVRVYAKGRGDAGKYRLAVAFTEQVGPAPITYGDVPDPPKLPSVPGAPCETFDPSDRECKSVCPPNGSGAPPFWQACVDAGVFQPKPEAPKPPEPPPPPKAPDPIQARSINAFVQGNETVITITAGKENGVTKDWTGQIMRGDTNTPMVGGTIKIYRVDARASYAKVKLTTDQVNANPIVIIKPPAP